MCIRDRGEGGREGADLSDKVLELSGQRVHVIQHLLRYTSVCTATFCSYPTSVPPHVPALCPTAVPRCVAPQL
eukprot:1733358-Rhodomonas_salina.1